MSDTKLKNKLNKYCRPSNCEKLTVPKVRLSPEIWGQISHAEKQQNLRLANVQTAINRAGIAVAKCIDVLLEAHQNNAPPQVDKLIKTTTDALALLGHANVDLSLCRREYLRPCLNQEYSTLCLTQYTATSLLFGVNLPFCKRIGR